MWGMFLKAGATDKTSWELTNTDWYMQTTTSAGMLGAKVMYDN